jgi:hypothetical protein
MKMDKQIHDLSLRVVTHLAGKDIENSAGRIHAEMDGTTAHLKSRAPGPYF